MLDAILSPQWEYRYFSFNSKWDIDRKERMASMRNGQGDHYHAVFSPIGVILKGFDHEAPMSPWSQDVPTVWNGVLSDVPPQFGSFLAEPAFEMAASTFCIWRIVRDKVWSCGKIQFPAGSDPDGSEHLLWLLDGKPSTYQQFALDYFEVQSPISAIEKIYEHAPLTRDLVVALNAEADWHSVLADATEISYSIATP